MMGMRRSTRLTAALIAASLVLVSPGFPCYQAVAAEFEGGAPKGADIKIIPALDLSGVKTGGIQTPGVDLPGLPQTAIPQTGVGVQPGVIPVLPAAAPGLTNAPAAEVSLTNPSFTQQETGPRGAAIERPVAETTLRVGAEAIAGAKDGDRGGILSWFWNRGSKEAPSVSVAPAVSAETETRLSKASTSDLTAIARDQSRSPAERAVAVRAIANRSDDPARIALEEIGTGAPVGDANDYEVRRQALRALAEQGKVVSLPAISVAHKQAILSQLAKSKPKLAVFDHDGTLEKSGVPASRETAEALKAVSDSGVRTVVNTGQQMTPLEPGLSAAVDSYAGLTAAEKAAIAVAPDMGARIYVYDKNGEPKIIREQPAFSANERVVISAAAAAVQFKHGAVLVEGERARIGDYAATIYLKGEDLPTQAAGEMRDLLAKMKVNAAVNAHKPKNGRPARLVVGKYDKSAGVAAVREVFGKTAGKDTVLIGNEFFGADGVDSDMIKGAPGALALSVGGKADPRLDNIFVWDTTGHEAAMEIAQALAMPAPAPVTAKAKVTGLISWMKAKWNEEGPKPPAPDDHVNVKTLLGNIVPSVISMAAYMLVTLAFVGVAVPVVGWTGYGILMSLSPMAGIAAANIMGNIFRKMGARNAMVINTALRIVSLAALPIMHLFGPVGMGGLLVGALAEGFLLSSIMTTSGSFLPALFPAKQIGNINGVMFMMFPLVQVVLGLWAHVGRFADAMSPFTIFTGASLLNALIVLPLTWLLIPNTKLVQNTAADPAAPKISAATRAKNFVKKFWKPMLALTAAIGLFTGLTWGLPALAAAGVGGKLVAAVAAFFKAHSALSAPLPIAAALIYWITRTDGFKALKEGKAAKITEAEKALTAKILELRAAGPEKAEELAAARAELKKYSGRQLLSIGLMSLSTLMYYPLYLIAAPHVAEVLAGSAGKLELAGQFLGALFFGALLSTSARTMLPSFKVFGKTINSTRVAQGLFAVMAGLFAATKIFVAGSLLGGAAVAVGGAAIAAGLIYLATRVTDRGWIKGAGVGFAAIWLPFAVWTWPALIPFLTVKTAMLLSLLAAGFVNGPNFVSLISYLMSNTERSENSKVTGVQGAFFNAAISIGYGLLTIASGFLNPAYPAVLAILGIINALIGGFFWRTASRLPGLSPTIFKPRPAKTTEAVKK
jgi:hypothetical protein